jgi:hypothetical protein
VEDGCGQEEVLKAGDAFEETELHVHRAKNLGTEEVEVYNTFIVPEGNPTKVNIPNNERRCGSLSPVLRLEAARFCPGTTWTLKEMGGIPNTTVHLIGASIGKSWKILDCGRTDGAGSLSIGGVFTDGSEGTHTPGRDRRPPVECRLVCRVEVYALATGQHCMPTWAL